MVQVSTIYRWRSTAAGFFCYNRLVTRRVSEKRRGPQGSLRHSRQPEKTGPPKPPGRVRIIGGAWRGRRIPVLDSEGLRPTGDRARETLFNWLNAYIPGAECLDLFAGTGALGLEALSRGARAACFVELESRAAEQLTAVTRKFGAVGAQIVCMDARQYLQGAKHPFDIVFVDPPFAGPAHDELCTLLSQGWLREDGWVYLEMTRERALPEMPQDWAVHREKTAGQVRFALVRIGRRIGEEK
jgi:16S rRNA (guanine966-N2)-methyltransferase